MAAPMEVFGSLSMGGHLVRLVTVAMLVTLTAGRSKYVSISLDAKWKFTPYLLEASEYVANVNSELFWAFVNDVVLSDASTINEASDEDYHTFVMQKVARQVSPLQLDLFQLSLSLRENSPVIEMYNQMARDVSPPADCDAFAVIGRKQTCDASKLETWVEKAKVLGMDSSTLYQFDHVYPGSDDSALVVVLYAELGSESFKEFHDVLRQMSRDRKIRYVLRHYVRTPSDSKVRLSGYGVELDIKSTEYKAKDDTKVTDDQKDVETEDNEEDEIGGFIFSHLRGAYPARGETYSDLKPELKAFRTHLTDYATELTPLKAWQYQDLSFQAAQRILSEEGTSALMALRDISQNFPVLARSLVKLKVNEKLKNEIQQNQQIFSSSLSIAAGDSAFYINGLPIEMDIYDMSMLMDVLRSEGSLMEGLFSLGVKGTALNEMMKVDVSPRDQYALDIRHSAIQYVNDLEVDKMYHSWPGSIQDLLRPQFPGMLRHVAKNIFHLVFIVDPSKSDGRELLKTAESFFMHTAPIRIGIVLVSPRDVDPRTNAAAAMSRAFCYIAMDSKVSQALSFITDIYEREHGDITADVVVEEFKRQYKDEDIDNVFGDNDDYDDCRKLSADFIDQTGLNNFPQVLMNGVIFKKESLTEERFEEALVTTILEATPTIQRAVYENHLRDKMSVLDWLMDQDHVLQRLNSRVLSPGKHFLDFSQHVDEQLYNDAETFATLTNNDMTAVITANMHYLYKKAEQSMTPCVTLWIVVDLETSKGRHLLSAAMKRLKSSIDLRVGVLFNPLVDNQDNPLNAAVYVALRDLEVNLAKNYVNKLLRDDNAVGIQDRSVKLRGLSVNGMDTNAYLTAVKTLPGTYLEVHRAFVQNALKFQPGQQGIVANGKVIGPFGENEEFTLEDMELLEKFTSRSSSKVILSKLVSVGLETDLSDLVMKVASLLVSKSQNDNRVAMRYQADNYSVLSIPAKPDVPAYMVDVIVDPATQAAQKLAPILAVLREVVNMDLRVFMNCHDKLPGLPIKSFYRYVLEPGPTFKNGVQNIGPSARFVDIPHKSLLTLKMNAPESWLVESVRSPYDLDNILLDEVDYGVVAEFELEYLLLEGHCYDASSGQPPRGLQFTLGTNSTPAVMDTIVMANLGYFQLKANPGTWMLRLREGRSNDIYTIASHEQTDTPPDSSDVIVVMNSFKSRIVRLKVEKKVDMRNEDLLKSEDKKEDKGLWLSLSSRFGGGANTAEENDDETLNIFSVASGHLYERFLRIMMVSVLKQTKSNVKFWFLKNFLSPTFKNFIPHMAEKYGFKYELVQYKWPRWLHQQTVKQRIIWGYKILFLDVLFPLDVKKFIFVDADQMVRTDLQELYDFDLGGAPYGYTPFCDSRSEMDGFRFWNTGYWRSHLGGRKYHISALYVVDLQKFRHIAAGDRLRGQYQGLSQDPNSLSNLDQDLPNNMIHQVAIKSLPQEWLWCETWCSDESKARAKTIDLCNNPLTKEPKLQAAMRILPEWKHYDYEIKLLWDSVYKTDTATNTEYDAPKTQDQDTPGSSTDRDEL